MKRVVFSMLLLAVGAANARAADNPGITVTGEGRAEAMPDVLELVATVEGNAQLAGDALEKYRGNKKRLLEAVKKLGIESVSVAGSGLAVNSGTPANPMAALQGQANQPKPEDRVAFEEKMTLALSGIDAMSAEDLLHTTTLLIDAAKDAGAAMGPGPSGMIEMQIRGSKPGALASFKLSQPEALRQKAYQAALAAARAKAQSLADLAGVELGAIVSIRETAVGSQEDSENGGIMAAYLTLLAGSTNVRGEFTSTEFKAIPVAVALSVQFAIAEEKP